MGRASVPAATNLDVSVSAQGRFTRTRITLMISRTAAFRQNGTGELAAPDLAMHRQGFLSLLLLSAWCGSNTMV